MSYPAERADALCGLIEAAKRSKVAKTRAYKQAICAMLTDPATTTPDVFEAITMCAWAAGADADEIAVQRLQAAKFFSTGSGYLRPDERTREAR